MSMKYSRNVRTVDKVVADSKDFELVDISVKFPVKGIRAIT